jgi:hypothetical protein
MDVQLPVACVRRGVKQRAIRPLLNPGLRLVSRVEIALLPSMHGNDIVLLEARTLNDVDFSDRVLFHVVRPAAILSGVLPSTYTKPLTMQAISRTAHRACVQSRQ